MNRKEIYAKIKEYNLAEAIKKTFHENYTRIPSANLECFISDYVSSSGEEQEVINEEFAAADEYYEEEPQEDILVDDYSNDDGIFAQEMNQKFGSTNTEYDIRNLADNLINGTLD